jgi:hypothetical protein
LLPDGAYPLWNGSCARSSDKLANQFDGIILNVAQETGFRTLAEKPVLIKASSG